MPIKGTPRMAAKANGATEGAKGTGHCVAVPHTSDGTGQHGADEGLIPVRCLSLLRELPWSLMRSLHSLLYGTRPHTGQRALALVAPG